MWLPVYPNPGGADHAFLVDAEGEAVAVAVFRLADEDRDVIGFTGPSVDWQWCSKIPRLQGKSVFGPEGLSRPRIFTGFSSGWIKVRRSTSSEVENLPESLSCVPFAGVNRVSGVADEEKMCNLEFRKLPFMRPNLILSRLFAAVSAMLAMVGYVSAEPYSKIRFEPIPSDILPSSEVRKLYQDSDGYIWIPTYNGLARYDGYGVVTYGMHDVSGVAFNSFVNVVAEDRDKVIWIGTERGLFRLDKKTGTISATGCEAVDDCNISVIICDTGNGIWVGSDKGLFRKMPRNIISVRLRCAMPTGSSSRTSLRSSRMPIAACGSPPTAADCCATISAKNVPTRMTTKSCGMRMSSSAMRTGMSGWAHGARD